MRTSTSVILLIILTALALPAAAQERLPGPDDRPRDRESFATDPRRGDEPSAERREEIRKKIEAIRIWRLMEELKLSAETGAKLSSIMSTLDQKRREAHREELMMMGELRRLVKAAKPDEAGIRTLLDKLEQNQQNARALRDQETRSTRDLLTPEQQARFLIFQQDFQREIRSLISGMGGTGPMHGGPGQRQGPGPARRPPPE